MISQHASSWLRRSLRAFAGGLQEASWVFADTPQLVRHGTGCITRKILEKEAAAIVIAASLLLRVSIETILLNRNHTNLTAIIS